MQGELVRLRAIARGRVQMVGFRDFVVQHSARLGLNGSVANRPDGTLECVVEGPAAVVEELLSLLNKGPRGARVESVDVVHEEPAGSLPPMRVNG